jgi:hypothetical protein
MINQLEDLKKENAALKEQISALGNFNHTSDTVSDAVALQQRIALVELQMQQLMNENDSLRKSVKSPPETADKDELINALNKAVKKERQLNEMLTKENKDLKDAIEKFK